MISVNIFLFLTSLPSPAPSSQVCGNGVVEGDEQCDCGSDDPVECFEKDPCCKPGNCTLKEGALCRWVVSECVYTCVKRL